MEYKPIILFFALLILFWWISSEDELKVDDITPSKEPKTQKGLKLKATASDGDNTVMVSTNDGDIKKASNVAKIDALKTELTGSLKIGTWTIEEQSDGNLVFYKGTKDTASDKPYVQFSGVDGNIYLNSTNGGNTRGWIAPILGSTVRRDTGYYLKSANSGSWGDSGKHYLNTRPDNNNVGQVFTWVKDAEAGKMWMLSGS